MANILTRKLELFGPLPDSDKRALDDVVRSVREVGPREDLVREGESPGDVRLIVEGFACRYKLLESGTRQIVAYLVPGDFCDLHIFILRAMDHSIATLSRCHVVDIPRAQIMELFERPAVARAFWWATLVDEATLREWLINVGARSAETRIAHLLCELLVRLESVGLTVDDAYELPITQQELGDTTGLTNVHVNRVLQRMRSQDMITLRGGHLVIKDAARLKAFSGFNPNYLHLDARPATSV